MIVAENLHRQYEKRLCDNSNSIFIFYSIILCKSTKPLAASTAAAAPPVLFELVVDCCG